MSSAALSVLAFGIYVIVAGLGFLVMPNTILGLLGVPSTEEPWIRIVGMVMVVIGYYYFQTGRNDVKEFFMWTVQGRVGVFVVLLLIYILGWGPWQVIIFGVVDLLGAAWTYLTSRPAT